jgi:hypothetical protein
MKADRATGQNLEHEVRDGNGRQVRLVLAPGPELAQDGHVADEPEDAAGDEPQHDDERRRRQAPEGGGHR